MKKGKPITRKEWSGVLLVLAIAVGGYLRFSPTLLAGFAVNDGGMFAVMVEDLKANGFRIPEFTTYNQLNIPYAYPPLGFYLGALASLVFGWDSTEVVRWVPALFASLSIAAFYFLALRLLRDEFHASVSTLFFAMLPRAFWWFVMGGGLTRSLGQFFMLLTLAIVLRLFQERRKPDIIIAGVLGGLAVLSHPEAAIYTFVSSVLFWVVLFRNREALTVAARVALVVLAIIAPWLLIVFSYHGVDPLLAAAGTGSNPAAVFHLVFFVFSEEPYVTVIAVLGLIGMANRLTRHDYLLPLWMALPFFVEGRSAAGPASIPLAMLATFGLVEVILPALQMAIKSDADSEVSRVERNVLIYLVVYLTFSAYQFGVQLSSSTLYPPDAEAMNWVKGNTPTGARFLVLTGTTSAACDSALEWFPALADRQSVFTIQGTEWIKGEEFASYISSTYAVQECLAYGDVACLDRVVDRTAYDFVYVSKVLRADNCKPVSVSPNFQYFITDLTSHLLFETVYETQAVLISRRR
jgi:hypothetical protein